MGILVSLSVEIKLIALEIRLSGAIESGDAEWIDEKKWHREFFEDVALKLNERLLEGKELRSYLDEKFVELIGNTMQLLDKLKDVRYETHNILVRLLLRIKLVEPFLGLLWEANKEISDEEQK